MKFMIVLFALVGLSMASTLKQDLVEVLSVIPWKNMREISKQHLQSDEAFKQCVAYLQGAEWQKLVGEVRDMPEMKEFREYLKEAGIDTQELIDLIHDLINGAGANQFFNIHRAQPSLRSYLDEIRAIFPALELLDAIYRKADTSKDFENFLEKITSQKAYQFVENVRYKPEVQRLADVLRSMEVRVDETFAFIYSIFGWE